MDLSTNLSFDGYLLQMEQTLQQLDLKAALRDELLFDQVLNGLVVSLSKAEPVWKEIQPQDFSLSFDGTTDGLIQLLIDLSGIVLHIIEQKVPQLDGNLDQLILQMLLFQFSVRLLYRLSGREVHPGLGELGIENVVATSVHKPVKLYQVLRQSHLQFMSTKFPDAIMIQEDISDQETN